MLAEMVEHMHDGNYRAPGWVALNSYLLEPWLTSIRTRVKTPTASCYQHIIRLHINPNIGVIPLQKLQPEDLDDLHANLLSDAARKGTVFRNVANIADPPLISRSGRSMNVWTGDQLRTFLAAIADHDLRPLYFLGATTGMRRGELAGLRWRNVDLDTARLTVNQQIVSVEYKLVEDDLKTASSRRTIDLDPRTVAMSRRHRRRQLEERMATGRRDDDGYVFAKPDGSPSTPTSSARPSNAS